MKILNFDDFSNPDTDDDGLNYLKRLIVDVAKYESFDGSPVEDLALDFYSGEINFSLKYKDEKDIKAHSIHFNNFCKQFDWCDKDSLETSEINGTEEIIWAAFEEDNGNIVAAATEFWVNKGHMWMTIKIH